MLIFCQYQYVNQLQFKGCFDIIIIGCHMKKVLMFQDYFGNGGIEKVIMNTKNNLNNKYQIDILSIVNKSNEKVISLVNKDYCSFFKRVIFGLRKYKNYVKLHQYNIIHIHCYNAFGLIYAKITSKYCKNIIVHAHGCSINNDFLHIKKIINSIIKKLFINNKYTYIAVSAEVNTFCFNYKDTIILSNGIDYSEYYFNNKYRVKYRKIYEIDDDTVVIGHIGRFSKQKNQEFVIKVFDEINRIKKNYKLFLIGEGDLKEKLRNKVKSLNLEEKIIFLNNRNDIPKLINLFDIYVFPSIDEGFGVTVVENEVNGKYVFVSDTITKDIKISNRLEFLSLNNNAEEWATRIINLKNEKFKLDNRLNISEFIKRLENIYRGFDSEN